MFYHKNIIANMAGFVIMNRGDNKKENMNVKKIDEIKTGRTEISLKDSERIDLAVSNHDEGERYSFLYLVGEKNVTIDFCNAELVMKHRVTPIVLDGCKNVVIKNLSIKYARRYYVQTEIVSFDQGVVACKPLDAELLSVENGILTVNYGDETLSYDDLFFVQEFERDFKVAKDADILAYSSKNKRYFELKGGILYFRADKTNAGRIGNYLCFFAQKRIADAILINDCKNIKLQNVNIFSSPAMGVMCQTSENISLECVNVIRDKTSEYQITSLADATHFFACRGSIKLSHCVFENMNDDATNIHGIYESVESVCGTSVVISKKHAQQFGVNSFKVGDRVGMLDFGTKKTLYKARIVETVVLDKRKTRLILDKVIPSGGAYLIENLSTNPKIHITDCRTGNNRPRGFLLASKRKTVVEKCVFYNSECGIGAFADTDYWYEAGAFGLIKITGNVFKSNYGGGTAAIDVSPTVKYSGKYFNGRLVIRHNCFEGIYKKAVSVSNTKKVIIEKNDGIQSAADSVKITDCGKTVIRK